MAILTGFPPSNTISPSVRISEQDLSFIAPQQSFHIAALVGFASKGPINVPTAISSSRQLHTVFGQPHPDTGDPYLLYAADQYLQASTQLYVVRVAVTDPSNDEVATTASIEVPVAGGQVIIQSATAGSYVFAVDSFFSWKLNGILASKTLTVLAGTYTAAALAADLNEQVDAINDGIQFAVNSNKIAVESTFAYGPASSIELVSVQDAIYGPAGISGLGTGMTVASTTGTADRYAPGSTGTAGTYNFTSLTSLQLQIVINGTDNVLIDNVVQVVDLTDLCGSSHVLSAIVTEINNQVTATTVNGFVAAASGNNLKLSTLTAGAGASILVKSSSSGAAIFGFSGITAYGTSPSGVTGDPSVATFGIVTGTAGSGTDSFLLTADSPGIDGNNTQVVIANDARTNTFSLSVYSYGVQVESWGNLTKDQSSSYYVETFLASVSQYVTVVDNTGTLAPPLNGTYALTGGTDGIPSDPDDQDTLLIGDSTTYTGLQALSEPEQIDIDLLACPGHTSTAVIVDGLLAVAQGRGDCLAIIDPPFGLTVEEIVQWQNGVHPLNNVQFNSDFGALYWPWVMIADSFNGINVWIPPSGSVLAVYAISDNLSEPWFAPAGTTRGIVPGIIDVFSRPTLTERDLMYGNENAINPIIQFADTSGFMVWGQKTLQRTPTALDRVNVRRCMFYIEKTIRAACRSLLFEPNDEKFVSTFNTICSGILDQVKIGRGITDYIIQDDSTINTDDVIDRNEFRANIGIIPIRAVEFIFIQFSIQRTGSINSPDTGT